MTFSEPSPTPVRLGLLVRSFIVLLVLIISICTGRAEEPLIASIRVEGPGPIEKAGIIEVLELKVGSHLDRARLREVITTLYAGGQVEWLRVEKTESGEGLDVVVRLSYQSKISQIKVRTKRPVLRVKVKKWVQLKIGDPVSSSIVEASRRRVERRLRERGYVGAVVDAYMNYNRKTNAVAVEFEVTAGVPQVVGSVVLEGIENPKDIPAALPKYKSGSKLTSRLEDRLRDRTETNLRKMGFWDAEVIGIERRVFGTEVELVIRVEPGPRYRLELEVPQEHSKLAGNAFPDPAQEELHPTQTEALSERVQERLQESGHLLATVTGQLQAREEEEILHLQIEPGNKLKVAAVEFPGAVSIGQKRLANAVQVKTGSVGGRFKQKLSDATLEADRKSIESLYHQEGFPDVVASQPILEPEGEDAVRVIFPVKEGQPWFVASVRVEGLPVETAAELETKPLDLSEDAPWSPAAVNRASSRLKEALADTGYPEGQVETYVDTSRPGRAAILFKVEHGSYVRIGNVVIAGLRHTREKLVAGVVRRAGVRTGEPLSRKNMLEAQRGLYELGLFRRVELVPMPGQEHRAERNIVVRCEEGEQKSYLFGVGYSNRDAARLILGWSHLNLLGGAHAFSAEGSFSQNERRYSLSLREKRTLGLNVPSYLAIYRTEETVGDRDLLRRGLWIDFGDRLKRPLRPWLRYEYEIIQSDSPPTEGPVVLFDEIQESKVASITPSLEWDTRDNPLAPTRGVFASASVQYAFPAFEADAHFLKIQTGATIYSRIWRGLGAAGLRLGVIDPISPNPDVPDNLQIPFAYRFFAGGRTTHRAFDTDDLGIPGQTILDGEPVGGNALILFNLEYRRRIMGQFYAAIFLDAGNVWGSYSLVNFGDIRWGPGIGLQYLTPAGPLRAEHGWKINPEEGESVRQFFISFGVPF